MTFLQPWLLWALPLIAVPVIIHLINRLRHRPQPWAAMRFLITATQSSVSQAKLRHFLILLFRVLTVAALILFVARPLAGGWLGWALSPAPEVVLLLLDRSASMETKLPNGTVTKREQALKLWTEAAKQFQGSSRFILFDSATGAPQEVGSLSFLPQMESVQATDTATDLPGLMQRAFNYLLENKSGGSEIWIASDLQLSNWQVEDGRWEKLVAQFNALPQKSRFRLLTFETGTDENASISLGDFSRRVRNGQAELTVALDIERTGGTSETMKLATTINGARTETDISISGNSFRWRQTYPLPSTGDSGTGFFELPADGNSRDNRVYFVFGEAKALRSTVVSTDRAVARVLQLAAGDMTQSTLGKAKSIGPDEVGTDDWSTNAMIVWQAPLPAEPVRSRLKQFVEEGGVAVFFPAPVEGTNTFEEMGWGETQTSAGNQKFAISQWNELDGPLSRTEEGMTLPVRTVEFTKRAEITGAKNVLATFTDGSPFLARKNLGKGEYYFCGSLPHMDWSTLGEGPVLVPMLQRLLAAGGKKLNHAQMKETGKAGGELKGAVAVEPTNANAPLEAGIYRLGQRMMAMNSPAGEKELAFVPMTEVRKIFANLPVQLHEEKGAGSDKLQGEIWRFFLVAMLLFLLAEGWLILPPKSAHDENLPQARSSGREGVQAAT